MHREPTIMKSLRRTLIAAAALTALALTGCGSKPPQPEKPEPKPDPTVVRLELAATTDANADTRGRATPVVVRYYLLQTTAAFDSADFFSLFERDEALLGAAKIVREEITLKPGQSQNAELKPQGEGKFLAVFVAYRDVNKMRWRATAAVPQNKTTSYSILVGKDGVSIAPRAP